MLTAFMTLAFFYLVIGDLITFHQKAIFDFDAFADQPFSKPHKPENIYKVKDKKDRVQMNLITFVSELLKLNDNPFYSSGDIIYCRSIRIVTRDYQYSSINYRGPPSLL